ncbi:MAG: hypothetical protein ACREUD_04750 [Gammaproteobacteria bacterium]
MIKSVLRWGIFLCFFTSAAAQPLIRQRSDIAGNWVIEGTALNLTGNRSPETSKWTFGEDGVLSMTSVYQFSETLTGGGRELTIPDTYDVTDGKIVTGRSGTFAVIEKTPDAMTLKSLSSSLHYFLKKR